MIFLSSLLVLIKNSIMNKLYLSCLAALLMMSIGACTKYEPIFGVAGNSSSTNEVKLKKDLVYIHKNDIYLVDEILANAKRLTTSPTSTKTHVVLNPSLDKIAYLNSNKTPVIIDSLGNQITILSQYTNVTDLLWHNNNGNPTLVILVNNTIEFYGPSLNIPSNPFSYVFPSDVTFRAIDALDINDNLDVFFTYRYQRPFSSTSSLRRYYHGAGVNLITSNFDESKTTEDGYYSPFSSSYSSQNYPYYHMVKFNEEANNATLGSTFNGRENIYSSYTIKYYNYTSTSNIISTQTTTLNSENYYIESNRGHVTSNPYQIRKFLKVLPPNTPAPTGMPNTYTINFNTQNSTPPTYFDWRH